MSISGIKPLSYYQVLIREGGTCHRALAPHQASADAQGGGLFQCPDHSVGKEGALEIGKVVREHGMELLWIPLENAIPPNDGKTIERVAGTFLNLETVLSKGGMVYVHYTAGIHRTGMVTHSFLLHLGFSEKEARNVS